MEQKHRKQRIKFNEFVEEINPNTNIKTIWNKIKTLNNNKKREYSNYINTKEKVEKLLNIKFNNQGETMIYNNNHNRTIKITTDNK